jgi:hypothetical protein
MTCVPKDGVQQIIEVGRYRPIKYPQYTPAAGSRLIVVATGLAASDERRTPSGALHGECGGGAASGDLHCDE